MAIQAKEFRDGFWLGKRVFLTGHTGFKGGWLTMWLASMGAKVTGFAQLPSTSPALFNLACVKSMTEKSIIGDIRDYDQLCPAVQQASPDIVFHLAAQPLVRRSYQNPIETYQTNVMGTAHLLEAVRHTESVRAVVVVTTDKCYENVEKLSPYRETDKLGGHDPYSSSKACAELVCSAYLRSYFSKEACENHSVAVATTRAGNVIGGGDWSTDRLVPDALRAFAAGVPLLLRNPSAIRPWQHVLDPLSGYLSLAQKLYQFGSSFDGAWNFGPDTTDELPVSSVVDKLVSAWGGGGSWHQEVGSQPHEAHFLKLNSEKSRRQLDWRPKYPLDLAVTKTVDWYQAFYAGKNMKDVSLSQLGDYLVN